MTRKEAKELLPIIKAYSEGKAILIKHDGEWFEAGENTEVYFSESPSDYRIKPESKYRPFKTVKECWDEMVKHTPFGWLSSIKTGNIAAIGSVNDKDGQLIIKWATNECFCFTAEDVSSDYVFADGTPFGIKEE